jgi:hypothetical protein
MGNTQETKSSTAKQIVIVILLGAVGSGAWTLIGEPLIQIFGRAVVRTISWFSATYLDSIYSEVGKGIYDKNSSLLLSVFTGFFIAFWTIAPFEIHLRWKKLTNKILSLERKLAAFRNGIASPESNEQTPEQTLADARRIGRKLRVFFLILVLWAPLSIAWEVSSLYRNIYSSSAVIYLERSIEILAPHLSDADLLKLRASYRAINRRDQFIALYSQLVATARANNVELPQFSPI